LSRDHAAFEALAGAIALGEANADERAAFAAHATSCATCAEDAQPSPLERLQLARDAESWRPEIGDALLRRIREARSKNVRRTFGVMVYAAGLSILLNVAVATGLAGRFYDRFQDTAQPPVVVAAPLPANVPAAPATRVAAAHRYVQRPLTAPIPHRSARGRSHEAGGRLGDVPDVLAGLVQPTAVTAARDVAADPLLLCAGGVSDLSRAACEAAPADLPH
jgi:hypothetical protein